MKFHKCSTLSAIYQDELQPSGARSIAEDGREIDSCASSTAQSHDTGATSARESAQRVPPTRVMKLSLSGIRWSESDFGGRGGRVCGCRNAIRFPQKLRIERESDESQTKFGIETSPDRSVCTATARERGRRMRARPESRRLNPQRPIQNLSLRLETFDYILSVSFLALSPMRYWISRN